MRTIELLPVDDDAVYVRHLYIVIIAWLVVTFLVGILYAAVALL